MILYVHVLENMYVCIMYYQFCFWFRIKSCFLISNFPRSLWLLAFNILYCCAAMVQWRPAVWTSTGSARCQRRVLCSHPSMRLQATVKGQKMNETSRNNQYGFFHASPGTMDNHGIIINQFSEHAASTCMSLHVWHLWALAELFSHSISTLQMGFRWS